MYRIIWKDHAGRSHEVHKTSSHEKAEAWVMRQVDADIRNDKLRSYTIQNADNMLWSGYGA